MRDKFYDMSDTDLMTGLFFGEARIKEDTHTDELKELLAIGNTVLNRANSSRFPSTIKEVILQPKQFSCFNENDPNIKRIYEFLTNPNRKTNNKFHYMSLYAKIIVNKQTYDFSYGADHYVAVWLYEKNYSIDPGHWMYQMKITSIYGGHIFLRAGKI